MKVLSYNIRNGADDTYDTLVRFINAEKPDILCLQEVNGWHEGSPSRIERFAQATGLEHWQFGDSNTDFKLVTFTRSPIIRGESVASGLWHSAVHIEVPYHHTTLNIWNVHLDPRAPGYRMSEVKRLLSLMEEPERVIIAGDLNSVSKADSYPSNLLNTLLARDIPKFGKKKLSYGETDLLTRAGLVDTAVRRHHNEATVPTASNHDENHSVALRLDYILASQDVDTTITQVAPIKNALTDVISDHYPVVATVN